MFAGLDIGRMNTKAVLMNGREVLARRVDRMEEMEDKQARKTLELLLKSKEISSESLHKVVVTGAGRDGVQLAHQTRAEVSCLALVAGSLAPYARTIIDVGAETSSIIRVNRGRAVSFVDNDVCAAGSGIFLDTLAKIMNVPIGRLAELSSSAGSPATMSSTCVVFAESEVVSLVHKGVRKADIIAGVHYSVAERISGMAQRIGIQAPVIMVGGVAQNIGFVKALGERLGQEIQVLDDPCTAAALGAAMWASRLWRKERITK